VSSTYGYDPNGNETMLSGATFGIYDAQDRLVSATVVGGDVWKMTYNNNGDALSRKVSGSI
jgi:YD repeat-containing protein